MVLCVVNLVIDVQCELMLWVLGFGKYYIDYMVLIDYVEGCGWYNVWVIFYGLIELDFLVIVLYYVQEVFEGFKVYCWVDGFIVLFCVDVNVVRLCLLVWWLVIFELFDVVFIEFLCQLIVVDKVWVFGVGGEEVLYLWLFIFVIELGLGVWFVI